jgi:hypothetical protein
MVRMETQNTEQIGWRKNVTTFYYSKLARTSYIFGRGGPYKNLIKTHDNIMKYDLNPLQKKHIMSLA